MQSSTFSSFSGDDEEEPVNLLQEEAPATQRQGEAATREEVEQVNRRLNELGYTPSVDPAEFAPGEKIEF